MIFLLVALIVLVFVLLYKINSLKNKLDCALIERESDSNILFLKSRYASMGETVGNIAHQWKQPLNAIGTIQTGIKSALVFQGEISKEKLLKSVDTSLKLIQHLAETIDTFYSFLTQQNRENTSFLIANEFETIRKITEYSFENSQIKLHFELHANPMIQGNANEFTHAILNLILNAKDALENSKTDSPAITVCLTGGEKNCTIVVSDNGGGICIEPIDSIFEWHISSKDKASGVGLYMAKNIIEKRFGGTISVENLKGGASFTITLPYAENGEVFSVAELSDEKLSLERIRQLTHKIIELEELKKTLKKWADIFEQAQWGIVIGTVEDQTLGLMNPAFARMHGYDIDELSGKKIVTVFAPECVDDLQAAIQMAHEEGYCSFESVHIRKDGSRFPVTIELMAVKDEHGNVIYRIVNIWDITEKKVSEEWLHLKRFALDHIKDAVFLIDENGYFQYVNEGACMALGYTREEFADMKIGDIDAAFPQERWSQHWNELKNVGSMTMELWHRRRDGSIFPVEVSANFIEFGDKHCNMAIARNITERLRLERQKDNERMRLFFERQLVGMAITSPDKGWIQTNEKLQQMLGYTHQELTQRTWTEMTYPDDLAPDMEQFEKLLSDEIEDYILEKRFIRKDGSIVYTNLAVSCVRNDDRSVNYVLALLEDITDRKLIEDQLKRSETSLKEAQKIAKMGSWVLELPSQTLTWSDETYRIFELDKGQSDRLHETFYESVHPDDREMVDRAYSKSLNSGLPFELAHRIVMPDGRIKYVMEACATQYNTDGNPILSIGIVQDITERKQMEEALKKSEQQYRTLIENSTDYIIRYDNNSRILYLNSQLAKIFGDENSSIIGQTPTEVQPDGTYDEYERVLKQVIESGQNNSYNITLPDAEGDIVHHHLNIIAERDYKGNVIGAITIGRDITEIKKVEEKLKKALELNPS